MTRIIAIITFIFLGWHVSAYAQGKVSRQTTKRSHTTKTIIRNGDYPKTVKQVNIPGTAKAIDEDAFFGYEWLQSVTIPTSVKTIGRHAFWNCPSLTSVDIPNSVEILDGTFGACKSLKSIIIPESVTVIINSAFWNCTSLTTITIPYSVQNIGEGCFGNCTNLNAFYGQFSSPDNRCLIVDKTLVGFAPRGLTSYTVSTSVCTIGEDSFRGCSELVTINLPNSLRLIGKSAFAGCTSLKEVIIPNSVTRIDTDAFLSCLSLSSVMIPESVDVIGPDAFGDCRSLINVSIPSNCKIYDTSFPKWCNVTRY